MKYTFLLFLFVPVFLLGQSDWGAFNQVVDAQKWVGKKFRLEAAVKSGVD